MEINLNIYKKVVIVFYLIEIKKNLLLIMKKKTFIFMKLLKVPIYQGQVIYILNHLIITALLDLELMGI